MVFKPSFKSFKNEKIIFALSILKLENSLFQNIFIALYNIPYIKSDFESNKKKVFWSFEKHSTWYITYTCYIFYTYLPEWGQWQWRRRLRRRQDRKRFGSVRWRCPDDGRVRGPDAWALRRSQWRKCAPWLQTEREHFLWVLQGEEGQ